MNSIDLLIIFGCLLFSAFFSGIEIAFVSANRLKMEVDRKQRVLSARLLATVTGDQSKFIGAMLVGNNIALVIYGIKMAELLQPVLVKFISSESAILTIQIIISTLIILITAEFLPKTLFRINPNWILNALAFPVLFFYWLLYIPVLLTIGLSNLFLRTFFKIEPSKTQPAFGKVDLDHYLREVTDSAVQPEELEPEIQILQNALDFSNIKARECMVPRTEVVATHVEGDINELRQKFIDTGLSKIIVFRDTIDNIIGYVHSYELFKKPEHIKTILLPVSIVPESMPANEILELFIQNKRSIAVVVDEFGGTSGIVTIEDIVEEIFGEIVDEHDQEMLIERQTGEHEYQFSARLEIDYLNEKYKLKIPESDDYETLAGFVINHYESIPQEHEVIIIDPFKVQISKVSGNRIEVVILTVEEPQE